MTLELRPPAAKDGRWSGVVRLEFHSRDAMDLSLELVDLAVEDDRLSFSVPKVAFGLDAFREVFGEDVEAIDARFQAYCAKR